MAVRNDPMNQRGPQPGTNLARPKEPCPGCGQTKQTSSTTTLVVTPEKFTHDQGAGLWLRVCTAVDAHLGMLETYAMSGIPGCSVPQLASLRDQIDNIIQTVEEQKEQNHAKHVDSKPSVEPDTPARARDGENANKSDHNDAGRFPRDLGSSDSEGDARGPDRSHGPTL